VLLALKNKNTFTIIPTAMLLSLKRNNSLAVFTLRPLNNNLTIGWPYATLNP
jgi:hypothetical protein